MLVPFLAGTLLLVAVPAILSAGIAFTAYDGLTQPVWVGFTNFRILANDPLFWIALGNTLLFIVLAVPLRIGGALALALLLSRPRRGVGGYRAAVYLPTVIPDVAYALIWLWIFNPFFGPVNLALGWLGLPQPGWLADGATARYPFVVMAAFQIGEGFVVLLAALRGIPREYFESGAIDGGSRVQLFRWLTLPLLAPWLILLTFRDIILSFQWTFTPSYLMTGGGPYYATFFLPFQIYEEAFDRFRYGIGSALMLLVFLLTGALLIALALIFRARGYRGEI